MERTPWDEPHGNPHALAAYEHAYDGVLVISDALRRWCIGQGLPRDKVFLVRNAPGYATTPGRVAEALARARRGRDRCGCSSSAGSTRRRASTGWPR